MRDEEGALAGYDLTAWELPPPPATLVDGVIARARESAMPSLVVGEDRPPRQRAAASRPTRWRWWLIGGAIAVAAAAVVAIGLWGIERAPSSQVGRPADTEVDDPAVRERSEQLQTQREEVDREGERAIEEVEDAAAAAEEAEAISIPAGPVVQAPSSKKLVKKAAPPITCDEVSCVLTNHDLPCCHRYRKPTHARPPSPDDLPDAVDRDTIKRVVDSIRPQVQACGASFSGTLKLKVNVEPSGEIAKTEVVGPSGRADEPADIAACIHAAALNMSFPKTKTGAAFAYPFHFANAPASPSAPSPPAPTPPCDADPLTRKGNELANVGTWDKALEAFEESLRCKPSVTTTKRAFVAACNAKDAAKAQSYYKKLLSAVQKQLLPVCLRNGLDPRADKTFTTSFTPCDAAALRARGEELLSHGMDAAGLVKLEESLACKADDGVRKLAFLSSCRAKDAAAAKRHFAALPATSRGLAAMCARLGVPVGDAGTLTLRSTPAATVLIDGVEAGGTPLTRALTAGHYKVTFTTKAGKSTTYTIEVKAGETTAVTKDLQ